MTTDNVIDPQSQRMQSDSTTNSVKTAATATPSHDAIPNTYEKYMELTQRVLQKSRRSLDTKEFIRQAYGEEKMTMLGGSDILQGILDGLLDKMASETILHDFGEYCESHPSNESTMTPKQRLQHIDQVIRFVLEWEARRDKVEAQDVRSAQQSLEAALLPKGVSTEDVVHYREHQQRLQALQFLQRELERVQEDAEGMRVEQAQTKHRIQDQLDRAHNVERQVEEAADACKMVTD